MIWFFFDFFLVFYFFVLFCVDFFYFFVAFLFCFVAFLFCFAFVFFLYLSEWDTPRLSYQFSASITCSSVLLDSWLQLYKCTQVNSTLLSSTHWLRIELHISLNHDRRKQTVKQNHGGSFSLYPCFHWFVHTILIIMKGLCIWRDCLTAFLDHWKPSGLKFHPSLSWRPANIPLRLFYTLREFWSLVQHSCSVPKWGAI